MTDRRLIASHKATDVNPPWALTHLTDAIEVDEYQLTCGDGWLTFDPREPDDRAQMVEIGNALLAAAKEAEQAEPEYDLRWMPFADTIVLTGYRTGLRHGIDTGRLSLCRRDSDLAAIAAADAELARRAEAGQ